MFKKLLENTFKKNPEFKDAMNDEGIAMLESMMGNMLGDLGDLAKDIPEDKLAEIMSGVQATIQESLDKSLPDLRAQQDKLADDQSILYAKWLHYLSLDDDQCNFEEMECFHHHLETARALSASRREGKMNKLYKQNEKTMSALQSALAVGLEGAPEAEVLERIQSLLSKGEDPNYRSLLKDTAMGLAYYFDYMTVLKLLLDSGGKADAIGWTDLHLAIVYGSALDVKAALPSDVILRKDDRGDTAIDLCAKEGDAEKLALLHSLVPKDSIDTREMVDALCRWGFVQCFHRHLAKTPRYNDQVMFSEMGAGDVCACHVICALVVQNFAQESVKPTPKFGWV